MKGLPFSFVRIVRPQIYRCERGWSWSPPPLVDFDLWYVMDGIGEVTINKKSIPISSGYCFVHQPGTIISATQNIQQRLLVFYAHFDAYQQTRTKLLSIPEFPKNGQSVRNIPFFSSLAVKCESSFRRNDILGLHQSTLTLQQMLLHLIEEKTTPTPSKTDERIQIIIQLLKTDPSHWYSIQELSERAHLSRAQFVRRFHSATGFSPNHFMIKSRIDRACQLLEETNMSIKEIAEALNYQDIFFFSKQFKKFKGYSPRQHPT